jgi:hypothetical protein
MVFDVYVLELLGLKLLLLETLTFSDVTFCDINVVLCYVLSQYQKNSDTLECFNVYPKANKCSQLLIERSGMLNCITFSLDIFLSTYSTKNFLVRICLPGSF